MRFLVLMIPGVYQGKKVDPQFAPKAEEMEPMHRFNTELQKSVKILGLDGLRPLTNGARLSFAGGKSKVTDGPFVEAKEVIGGYWLIEADSKEQVVELFKRCPADPSDVIEIRPIFAREDFPIQIQKALKGAGL